MEIMLYRRIYISLLLVILSVSLCAQNVQTIHVKVALCDNVNQGIVKVPAKIGNGQDPDNNLYWGCAYGVRTYFKGKSDWKEIKRYKVDDILLERIVFQHKTKPYYLVADAYDGKYIKQCTVDFLNACAGLKKDTIIVNGKSIRIEGNAKLLSYIGHNGLMDFSLDNVYQSKDNQKRDAIILACASKPYFAPYLKSAKTYPLVWTTNLMSPEAYTLYDAVKAYINGNSNETVRENAALAYSKYQKCGVKAARRLLVTGW